MFFYHDTAIRGTTREELERSECPICKSRLAYDWRMPIRYSLTTLIRFMVMATALALLLYSLGVKLEERFDFHVLDPFTYAEQMAIILIFLACVSLPAAFGIILLQLKLMYFL